MGWRKKLKKVGKAVTSPFKKKIGMVKGLLGKVAGSDDGGGEERSEAASQLIKKDVNRQAGGAQINYTTEEWT